MIDGTKFHSHPGKSEAKRIDEEQDDRGMILHPDLWPKWPMLPVKRRIYDKYGNFRDLECGVLFENTRFTVYVVNLFMLPKTFKEFQNTKHYKYSNVDELLADKWIVD
ncbi:MAG: hypothetical protein ACWGQW_04010 [bacterium]